MVYRRGKSGGSGGGGGEELESGGCGGGEAEEEWWGELSGERGHEFRREMGDLGMEVEVESFHQLARKEGFGGKKEGKREEN